MKWGYEQTCFPGWVQGGSLWWGQRWAGLAASCKTQVTTSFPVSIWKRVHLVWHWGLELLLISQKMQEASSTQQGSVGLMIFLTSLSSPFLGFFQGQGWLSNASWFKPRTTHLIIMNERNEDSKRRYLRFDWFLMQIYMEKLACQSKPKFRFPGDQTRD